MLQMDLFFLAYFFKYIVYPSMLWIDQLLIYLRPSAVNSTNCMVYLFKTVVMDLQLLLIPLP
jgi:hypothetical protein